jgi:hypothetical protein
MGLGRDVPIAPVAQQAWGFGGGAFAGSGPHGGRYDLFRDLSGPVSGLSGALYSAGERLGRSRASDEYAGFDDSGRLGDFDQETANELADGDGTAIDALEKQAADKELLESDEPLMDFAGEPASTTPAPAAKPMSASMAYDSRSVLNFSRIASRESRAFNMPMGRASGLYKMKAGLKTASHFGLERGLYRGDVQDASWLISLFPQLPPAPEEPKLPKERWPAEARQLAEPLLRTAPVASLAGGLVIEQHLESFEPRWDQLTGRSHTLALVSPAAWLVRRESDGGQTTVQWCDEKWRRVVSADFLLGRVRQATPRDRSQAPWGLPSYLQQSLETTYPTY